MILIVGLGNPGRKYVRTRHSLGFWIIDKFLKENNFPKFKLSRLRRGFGGQAKKFDSLISEGKINNEKIILAKPKTFMNESGKAVKKLVTSYQLLVTSLWIIHDDIDLPLGEIKIVKNRGAAGHKGVQSIIDELGTKNFIRFRIGIKPKRYHRLVCSTEKFVLQKFTKKEEKVLKNVVKRTCQAIKVAMKEGIEKAMQKYNC